MFIFAIQSLNKFKLMSRIIRAIIVVIFTLSISSNVSAQDYKSSAGLRLGTYIAASVKTFISEKAAVEVIAGISREGGNSIATVGGFYEIHNQFTNDIPTLKWYYGGGAFIALGNKNIKTNLAVTGIIGLEYTLESTPLNLFIDGIPYISLTNEYKFDAEASLGARYTF